MRITMPEGLSDLFEEVMDEQPQIAYEQIGWGAGSVEFEVRGDIDIETLRGLVVGIVAASIVELPEGNGHE